MGMMFACFHICGMMFLLRARLNVSVRNCMAVGPRCFRWWMFMLSGPRELLFLLFRMALMVSCGVMMCSVVGSLWINLLMVRWSLDVLCVV